MILFGSEALDKAKQVLGGSGGKDLTGGSLNIAHTFVNLFIMVIGSVAVIMVIVGALRYTLSGGDPQATKAAKDTILYAIVGVVVAVIAYAAVQFVFSSL